MLPRVDTGLTMAPAWPSAKKVLDVKEQVASSEIPAEYFHKSPVSMSDYSYFEFRFLLVQGKLLALFWWLA